MEFCFSMRMSEIIDKILSQERETLTYQKKGKEECWNAWRPQKHLPTMGRASGCPASVYGWCLPVHNGSGWKRQLKCKWGEGPRAWGPLTSLSLKGILSGAPALTANGLLCSSRPVTEFWVAPSSHPHTQNLAFLFSGTKAHMGFNVQSTDFAQASSGKSRLMNRRETSRGLHPLPGSPWEVSSAILSGLLIEAPFSPLFRLREHNYAEFPRIWIFPWNRPVGRRHDAKW